MDAEADKNLFWRIQRYQSIQEAQARGVRKRFLISGYCNGAISGAYIGVGSSTARYAAAREPGYSTQGPEDRRGGGGREAGSYSKAFAMDIIANIRTDLDAFSEVEQAVLMNHGYALMDAAIRTHVPALIWTETPFALPRPEFAPPAMSEDEVRRKLAWFGEEEVERAAVNPAAPRLCWCGDRPAASAKRSWAVSANPKDTAIAIHARPVITLSALLPYVSVEIWFLRGSDRGS